MITSNISTISDLRFKTKEVLAKTKTGPVILFHRSTPIGTLLSYTEYEELLNTLDDYYLAQKAGGLEAEENKKVSWITHDKVKKLLSL